MLEKEDHRMALIQAFKKDKKSADPAAIAREDFRSLLRLSLNDLMSAGSMAFDRRLPECLSSFAQEIIRTDDGVPFRPQLRRLIKDCLDNEIRARECMDYIRSNKTEIDSCIYNILHPLLGTLIGDLDAHFNTNEQTEKSLLKV
jgi:hypothetical protein